MDEAASRLKMEIDSKPKPIDVLERRIAGQLEVEKQALARRRDRAQPRSAPSRDRGARSSRRRPTA